MRTVGDAHQGHDSIANLTIFALPNSQIGVAGRRTQNK